MNNKLEIKSGSENYTAQVVKLSALQPVTGLDNLVRASIFGNDCLVGKDTNVDELHLFFPAECKLSTEFLHANSLFRHTGLNKNPDQKGFFEDNGRVKAIKFKGVISTGFVIPVSSLYYFKGLDLKVGQEFNTIDGHLVCEKNVRRGKNPDGTPKSIRIIDQLVDSRMAPEHFSTAHLLRNIGELKLDDYIAVTYKLHGTSARYFHALTKRQLTWYEKLAKKFGLKIVEEEYNYVSGSRKVIKSLNFKTLDGKGHFYDGDIWSHAGERNFADKLNKGEAVYCEIIGKDQYGKAIQQGYSYGFDVPKVYIYRISDISPQGVEIDLPYLQMKERAAQLGVEVCPEYFYGTLRDFLTGQGGIVGQTADARDLAELIEMVTKAMLDKPDIIDPSVIGEGFVIRKEAYPRPTMLKIKSPLFILAESKLLDDPDVIDVEEDQS